MTYSIHFHPGYEKDDEGVWTVWDDDSNFGPAYEGLDLEDCQLWIDEATLEGSRHPSASDGEGGSGLSPRADQTKISNESKETNHDRDQ